MEAMKVGTEIWPLAADRTGLWLVSAGARPWAPAEPVMAASEPYAEVMLELARMGLQPNQLQLLHSTSWRQHGPRLVLTYAAVIRLDSADSYVHDAWPDAAPLGLDLFQRVGAPPTHGAIGNPAPRMIDVLHHVLRHLRFLIDNDVTVARALDLHWHNHLRTYAPALATMYHNLHDDGEGVAAAA